MLLHVSVPAGIPTLQYTVTVVNITATYRRKPAVTVTVNLFLGLLWHGTGHFTGITIVYDRNHCDKVQINKISVSLHVLGSLNKVLEGFMLQTKMVLQRHQGPDGFRLQARSSQRDSISLAQQNALHRDCRAYSYPLTNQRVKNYQALT